jgi:hypothetical protein
MLSDATMRKKYIPQHVSSDDTNNKSNGKKALQNENITDR